MPGRRRPRDDRTQFGPNLVLAGLRWRAWSSVAMFVVAVFGAAVSAFGIMYLHGADQSILTSRLDAAVPYASGLTLQASQPKDDALLATALHAVPRPSVGAPWFGAAIETKLAAFTTVGPHKVTYRSVLASRTGVCAHLVMTEGACRLGPDDVLLSRRTAALLGVRVGQRLDLALAHAPPETLVVSGLFKNGDPRAAFWWGSDYFPFGTFPPSVKGSPSLPNLDDAFASPSTVASVAPQRDVTAFAQLPYEAGSLFVDQVGGFRSGLSRFEASARSGDGVRTTTQLLSILAAAAATEHTTGTIVDVIDLQLVLLGLFVLYFVTSRTAADRQPDVRLAALRGYRTRSAVAVALAEPIVLVVAAVPVGLLVAWAAATVTAAAIGAGMGAATLTVTAVGAAVGAGVVGIVAAALGTVRTVSSGVGNASTAESPRASTWRLVGDVTVVVAAAAALFELVAVGVGSSRGASSNPLAALAPGILALAFGVVGARGVPLLLRATHGVTARSRRLALSLTVRRVARRREFAAQIMLVTLALGLATFAAIGWSVAGRNRTVRSQFQVGATRVLSVAVRPGVTFVAAVRRADGGERSAMAAVLEHGPGGTTLAVDSSRMPSVMDWPSGVGPPLGALARQLAGHPVSPPVVTGSAVRVTIDTTRDVHPLPRLWLDLFDVNDDTPRTVLLGTLAPGDRSYSGTVPCPGGCRLVNFELTWTPLTATSPTSAHVDFALTSLQERRAGSWDPVPADIHAAHRWTSRQRSVHVHPAPHGLGVTMSLASSLGPWTVGPATTQVLPVVVTPATTSKASGFGGPLLVGLDGNTVAGHTVGEAVAVPGVGEHATIVDLTDALQLVQAPLYQTTPEVWLSSAAPTDIVAMLAGRGVTVLGSTSVAQARGLVAHNGVTLAYLLFLVAAVAAAVLAVGASGFALANGARRRTGELALMGALGAPQRTLWRTLWGEQALAAGAGIVLGSAAGVGAAAIALRSIPEFVDLGIGPPLELGLPPLVVGVTIAAACAGLVVVAGVGARFATRRATITRIGYEGWSGAPRRAGSRPTSSAAQGAASAEVLAPPPPGATADGDRARPRPRGADAAAAESGETPGGVPVRLSGVVHIYRQSDGDVVGLRGVDLDIDAGEMVALLGPSGMGKTTLMRLMGGVMVASAGVVRIGERDLGRLRGSERRRLLAGEISYVVQGTEANVLPFATALENVWFAQHGARARGLRPPWSPKDLLGTLGLLHLGDRRLVTLPHGPQQLVAVACGVSTGPRLLLADEPTAQLSEASTGSVIALLRRINAAFGTTVVIVTHEPYVAASFPRTVTIRDGRVGAEGLHGEEYAVIDGSGSVQLPPEILKRLPPNTRVRVVATPLGAELQHPEVEPESPEVDR
jgi:ABC-type lipoprotein export system ATPase subunit